jgi:hypothetical protein
MAAAMRDDDRMIGNGGIEIGARQQGRGVLPSS